MIVALALASGFLFFDWWLVLVEIVLGVVVWSFVSEKKLKNFKVKGWFLWVVLLGLLLTRLYPFFFSGTPFGYDTGIYRQEFWSAIQAAPDYLSNLFLGLPLISDVGLLFGNSLDFLVSYGYVLVYLLFPLSLFVYVDRKWGRKEAVIALFLFTVSLVQWKAYTMILYKQVLALALVFFSFSLLDRKSFLVIPVLAFTALLQPLDALLVGLSVLVYGLLAFVTLKELRKYFGYLLATAAVAVGVMLLLDNSFWLGAFEIFSRALVDPSGVESSLRQGVFLSLSDFGYQAAFLFVFGVLGFIYEAKEKKFNALSVYFLLMLLWVALRMFFFQRLLIQFDVVLIVYASLAFVRLYRSFAKDETGRMLFAVILVGVLAPFAVALYDFEPAVDDEELQGIVEFCEGLEPGVTVAATDSYYAPWLWGYCLDQRVFGPGVFDNSWSRRDWKSFWTQDKKKVPELLSQYEGELYFYVGENQPQLEPEGELFSRVGEGWYKRL